MSVLKETDSWRCDFRLSSLVSIRVVTFSRETAQSGSVRTAASRDSVCQQALEASLSRASDPSFRHVGRGGAQGRPGDGREAQADPRD